MDRRGWPRRTRQSKPHVSEGGEQRALVEWARANEKLIPELEMLAATMNGVRVTIGQAVKLRAMGLSAGYPDLLLDVPRGRYHGLRIEMKVKGGRLSIEQRLWLSRLNRHGYCTAVCYGFIEARAAILAYLALRPTEGM